MTATASLLEFNDVHVHFPIRQGLFKREVGRIRAVNGVSFDIKRGQAFGLVGESGCGKSTVARAALKLEEPTSGSIRYAGEHVSLLVGPAMVKYRRKMQAVFQDPFSSLNPRQKAGQIIAEPIRVHGLKPPSQIKAEVHRLLDLCGLPTRFEGLYPHEMSGGQRQRIGIARALAMNPELIVADEAVSALDVSIQAQIITLLEDLQRELGLTYLFIGHDLSVVRHICDHVAVMYLGRIVESAPSEELFSNPTHPYTRALIDAVPNPDPAVEAGRHVEPLAGEVPSPANPPSGCVFHPRCPLATDRCRTQSPDLQTIEPNHDVACWNSPQAKATPTTAQRNLT
ncbi:MAG: peptide ABC transporter substrate-binding protein [Rhodobacteraceae bacterium]|nr:peptide ABC transporter substrate-binding protein [Paracoccaceae bacterium]